VQVVDGGLRKLAEWQAHDLEVWSVAFSRHESWILYTGSDDCTFKAWDIKDCCAHAHSVQGSPNHHDGHHNSEPSVPDGPESTGGSEDSLSSQPQCVFSDRRTHSAGVCTISPHWQHGQHVLATGSYDERVRLWDTRQPARPRLMAEANTGGGNWRLRWHPEQPALLLAACMYNGCAVLRASADFSQLQVVQTYTGHGSISYGADWFRGGALEDSRGEETQSTAASAASTTNVNLAATCSFYDRLLHLWSPQVPS